MVPSLRSNAFHYVFQGRAVPFSGERFGECPVWRSDPGRWDPDRELFVQHQGQVARSRTETRDFSPEALRRVKDLGQLYLDRSDGPAPTDFARDLVLLTRSAVCAPCPARDCCPGLFLRSPLDVFSRDDQAVRACLATLTGAVLDVGCGPGPYEDLLAPRVRAGLLRYTGIDPDLALLQRVEARRGWGRYRHAHAESYTPDAPLDHVLVLRSWNHLQDPDLALARWHRALGPGGTLLVVDNGAYGLVRTRAQAARAEAGPAGFEHHRNDEAQDAHARIVRQGFVLLDRQDRAPGGSNQWRLWYRKDPGGTGVAEERSPDPGVGL
jgi:SAM-dependent methyltransferase